MSIFEEYGALKQFSVWEVFPSIYPHCLALWVKISADDNLNYFPNFLQKTGFDISCKLSPSETICMQCQTKSVF